MPLFQSSVRILRALVMLCLLASTAISHAGDKPWPIKVVVVTTFEVGADTGDQPGEFQYWVEREHLNEVLPFPGGVHPLRTNADHSILGVVSGMSLANAGPSIMALGLDPRFDLSHAYWLINGIAGVDPHDATLGSAAWADYVVNDVAREIDPREAPTDWRYGLFAIGAKRPDEMPQNGTTTGYGYPEAFALNARLVNWAYGLTRGLILPDTSQMADDRAKWKGFPNAQKRPFVLKGDSFASDYYWHGKLMTRYANDWVRQWTQGHGNFVMTNMEDSAMAEALTRLNAMHRVDFKRVLVLRTASNYSMQAPGHTAVESVTAPYIAYIPSLESAYLVGSTVVNQILANWPEYEAHIPETWSGTSAAR